MTPKTAKTLSLQLQSERGMSLLEVLIAAGITVIVGLAVATVMRNQFAAQTHINLRADQREIANTLNGLIDCTTTLAPFEDALGNVTCPANALIPILNANGKTIILAPNSNSVDDATKIGAWTLRAACEDASNANPGLVIQSAKPKPGTALDSKNPADFFTDQLTGRALTWFVPQSNNYSGSELYPLGARPCRGLIQNPVSKAPPCTAGATYCSHNYGSSVVRTGDLKINPGPAPDYNNFCNSPLTDSPSQVYRHPNNLPNGWSGQADCPSGYVATGGGVNCEPPSVPGRPICGAVMVSSYPLTATGAGTGTGTNTGDPVSWFGKCCRQQNCPSVSPGAIWVSCVPKSGTGAGP